MCVCVLWSQPPQTFPHRPTTKIYIPKAIPIPKNKEKKKTYRYRYRRNFRAPTSSPSYPHLGKKKAVWMRSEV